MSIVAWVVLGLIAGAIAKFIMPGKDPGGWIITIVIGIVGAIIGGFVGGKLLGIPLNTGDVFNLPNLGLAIGGSLILLIIYRFFKR